MTLPISAPQPGFWAAAAMIDRMQNLFMTLLFQACARRLPVSYAAPAISRRSQPRRYSRVRYWFASRQFVMRNARGSHSIRWPTRNAMLPNW